MEDYKYKITDAEKIRFEKVIQDIVSGKIKDSFNVMYNHYTGMLNNPHYYNSTKSLDEDLPAYNIFAK